MGPSGSHYIIGPLQTASGPRKKEKTAMAHFWDTHLIINKYIIYFIKFNKNIFQIWYHFYYYIRKFPN